MKDFSIIIVILILVFVPGYYAEKYLESSGERILKQVAELENEIKEGKLENVDKVERLKKDWETEQSIWNILSNHQNTDDVQKNIEILLTNYENKEDKEALVNLAEIRFILEDVPRGEKIRLVNIF